MTTTSPSLKTLLLLLALLPLSMPTHAASRDRQQPLEIEADRKHSDLQSGQAVYEGKVIIKQGRMITTADKATVNLKNGQLDRIQLEGKLVNYRDVDEQNQPIHAQAQRVDYQINPQSGDTLLLSGQASIERNQDSLQSERILYNLKSEVMDAGGGKGERVHMTLQPRSTPDNRPDNKPDNAKPAQP